MRRDPVDLRQALQRLAARQGGYFTASQAREVGYSHQAQKYHTDRGTWERAARGVYRIVEWPEPEHADLILWHLWSGGRAVASHETALTVHDLGDVMPARIHLTVPRGFRGRADAVRLHTADLPDTDVERREGFAVTTPGRSLADVANGPLELDQLERAIEEAIDRGLVSAAELVARAAAVSSPGARAMLLEAA